MITGPKKLVAKAIFIADVLDIANLDFDLEIKRSKKLKDFSAECDQISEREFEITIAKGFSKSFETEVLGHELVHVKQYLTGTLVDRGPGEERGTHKYLWRGKEVVLGNTMDEYYLSPWELEARALEAYIAYRWSVRKK